jgi:hypothetical protein
MTKDYINRYINASLLRIGTFFATKVSHRTDCFDHSTHIVLNRGKIQVEQPDISYVTWSAKGISVFYKGAMVVHLSAEDMYPLAVPAKAVPLVASELRNMAARAN